VILEATFRILPLPETSGTQLFLFDDPDAAWRVATRLIEGLLAPAAVEVLNRTAAAKCRAITGSSKKKAYGLAVAFEGFVEAVERQTRELSAMAEGAAVALTLKEKEQDLFWRPATDGFASDEGDRCVRGKISVPISQTQAAEEDAERTLPTSAVIAHAASGIVYFTCPSEGVTVEDLAGLRKRVNALGGWLNLEAAPRAIKKGVGVWDTPPGGVEIMKRIRRAFDPKGTLNPGRFVEGM
jgi:glycolate oxidase